MKIWQTMNKIMIVIILGGLINIARVNATGSFSCKYNYRGKDDITDALGFSSYTLSSGGNTLSEAYDNGAKEEFGDGGDAMGKYINGKRIVHSSFDIQKYKELASDRCPSKIYFCPIPGVGEGFFNVFDDNSLYNHGYDKTYSLSCLNFIWEDATEEDLKPNGCFNTKALSCKEYIKDVNGKTLYIELGKTSDNNYVSFSYDADFGSSNTSADMQGDLWLASDNQGNSVNVMKDDNNKTFFDYISCADGSCNYPNDIQLVHTCSGYNDFYYIFNQGSTYNNVGIESTNQNCSNPVSPNNPENPDQYLDIDVDFNFCEDPHIQKTFQIIGYILFVMKILVPLILLGMGTVDFAKAAISSDDQANKKALSSFIRRCIIAIIIFFIPTILNYTLILIDGATEKVGNKSQFSKCTSCLLNPGKDCPNASLEVNTNTKAPSTGGQSGATFGGRE